MNRLTTAALVGVLALAGPGPCAQAGIDPAKEKAAIAKVIECGPDQVGVRVKAMSPVERGVLATELGIEWGS